jgi:manganese/zinc/iron transport system permease protein
MATLTMLGRWICFALLLAAPIGWSQTAAAAPPSSTDASAVQDADPSVRTFLTSLGKLLTLQDHNTRVVLLGTAGLGFASGLVGGFMLLRKRALLGDALSHATLPGIGIAFIVMTAFGASGKWLPGLLMGAAVSGAIGVGAILLIVHLTRIKEDAALGIVLSVAFGLGVAILGIIQNTGGASAAGLASFIYGKTASMVVSDVQLILIVAGIVSATSLLLLKEFRLLCFDHDYAGAQGWPVVILDAGLMALVVTVTVIGLQAVGLILMVAMLVIPPAVARFWTERLTTMLLLSAVIGGLSGLVGSAASALAADLPTGPLIVIVAGGIFLISMFLGRSRGVLVRAVRHRLLLGRVAEQHVLRAMWELQETAAADAGVTFAQLMGERSWSARRLRRLLRSARRDRLVEALPAGDAYRLTAIGERAARRVVRNHRLWELYLITHADIAPSHVDRDADEVEHVLSPAMIAELEGLLADAYPPRVPPPSPHRLAAEGGAA